MIEAFRDNAGVRCPYCDLYLHETRIGKGLHFGKCSDGCGREFKWRDAVVLLHDGTMSNEEVEDRERVAALLNALT